MSDQTGRKSRAWIDGYGWSLKRAWELGIMRYDDSGNAYWAGESDDG